MNNSLFSLTVLGCNFKHTWAGTVRCNAGRACVRSPRGTEEDGHLNDDVIWKKKREKVTSYF